MKEWELARYLIDAKKNVDSLIFIDDNIDELSNIDIYTEIKSIQTKFYLNLCFILDDVYGNGKKKDICEKNNIINEIYRQRDKDKAHKDKNYKKTKYSSICEIIGIMKKQIYEVKNVCEDRLPFVVTLDFVSHDKNLFRLIHRLNKNEEERIKKKKYTNLLNINGISKEIFSDTEDYKNIKYEDTNNYAVEIKDGINLYEGIQERQDALIKLNLLFGGNIWVSFNENNKNIIEQLVKNGLVNEYGMPLPISQMNKEKIELFKKITNEGGNSE